MSPAHRLLYATLLSLAAPMACHAGPDAAGPTYSAGERLPHHFQCDVKPSKR